MQRYCSSCVQPDTRPGITLNESGLCSACIGHEEKERLINWDERRKDLEEILDGFRGARGAYYDCIVPVSGGKDSTYQVYVLKKQYGMNPLCVTFKTPLRTELGQKNLDNLCSSLGVDLLELSVNPNTERKFILKTLRDVGDCSEPFHLGMFAYTLRAAINYKIPLVVWGENPQLEYGGAKKDRENMQLDYAWLTSHGFLKKMAEKWADDSLTLKELFPFTVPSDEDLKSARIYSTFLGSYLKWDLAENVRVAKSVGFESRKEGPVMGIYDHSDIDCKLIALHHYPKWLKFGMTRTFDNVSIEIRHGRMTRDEAIAHIRKTGDDMPPHEHLEAVSQFLGVSISQIFDMLEPHRNLNIWQKDSSGEWYIPGYITG